MSLEPITRDPARHLSRKPVEPWDVLIFVRVRLLGDNVVDKYDEVSVTCLLIRPRGPAPFFYIHVHVHSSQWIRHVRLSKYLRETRLEESRFTKTDHPA